MVNLTTELDRFKVKVKERPDEIRVTRAAGFTGGGDLGPGFAILFLLLASAAAWHGRRA